MNWLWCTLPTGEKMDIFRAIIFRWQNLMGEKNPPRRRTRTGGAVPE